MIESKEEMMRRFILERSEVLFSRYGYRNTSMDRIAEKCDISKPTLYKYFKNKNAIFNGIFDRFYNETSAKVGNLMRQDKDKRLILEEIIDLSLDMMREKKNFLKMLVQEHHVVFQECEDIEEQMKRGLRRREETSRRLGGFMKELVCSEILKEFSVEMLGTTLSALLEGAFLDSIKEEFHDHEKQKKLIMRLLTNGVLA